jgi:hypothetical protein
LPDGPAPKRFSRNASEASHHLQINQRLDLTLPDIVQYLPDAVTPKGLAAMIDEPKTTREDHPN